MDIEHYAFGYVRIGARDYYADMIVFPDHVQERWWRQQGHRPAREDLETVLADPPRLLLVGTGSFGRMQVPEETIEALRAKGVEVRISKTGKAVEEFNRQQKDWACIVAALHLTC